MNERTINTGRLVDDVHDFCRRIEVLAAAAAGAVELDEDLITPIAYELRDVALELREYVRVLHKGEDVPADEGEEEAATDADA